MRNIPQISSMASFAIPRIILPGICAFRWKVNQLRFFTIVFSIFCSGILLPTTVLAQADAIDPYIRGEMSRRHVPGFSLVVIKDRKIVKAGNYGLANVELNVRVNERTSFEIASMSKQFTAAAMLLLLEEGKVGLDDTSVSSKEAQRRNP